MTQKEENPTPISIGFVSLGCAKNLVDSQIMAGELLENNLILAPSPEKADVVIVNTCAFIQEARTESIDMILSVCEMKQTGSCKAVIVTGCLSQRYGPKLRKNLPDVDAFLGLDELERIGEVVRQVVAGTYKRGEAFAKPSRLYEPRRPGIAFTGGPFAYLKIAEGCNHGCSFCAIPQIRGDYRSRPVDRIVEEAEHLLDRGFRELNLISQDTTLYGRDLPGHPGLPDLLRALGKIGGHFWIRLLYGFPSHVSSELLETMGEIPQVCHYLDLPVQHSHPDILRAMHRAETIEAVASLGERLRKVIPDITLRTTCLVGFPGETEEHFQHLLNYAGRTEFDHLGVFVFSPEENTAAANLPGRPDSDTAEQRRVRLLELQKSVVERKARQRDGTCAEVLVERRTRGKHPVGVGRAARQAPEVDGETLIAGLSPDVPPGTFVSVRYTELSGYDMKAEFVPEN